MYWTRRGALRQHTGTKQGKKTDTGWGMKGETNRLTIRGTLDGMQTLRSVEENLLRTRLAHQACILLHLFLVAEAFLLPRVGSIRQDRPLVQHHNPAQVFKCTSITYTHTQKWNKAEFHHVYRCDTLMLKNSKSCNTSLEISVGFSKQTLEILWIILRPFSHLITF